MLGEIFCGQFAGGIQAARAFTDRMKGKVFRHRAGLWPAKAGVVQRGGRGQHKAAHAAGAGGFQQIDRAAQVDVGGQSRRLADRHAQRSGGVHHCGDFMLLQ